MVLVSRTALAAVAIGLLAGCANPAPTSFVPGASPNQSQSLTEAPAVKARAGRVLYIADIDGQPGVGQIHVYTADMKKTLRTVG
jgi:hypothetical protein